MPSIRVVYTEVDLIQLIKKDLIARGLKATSEPFFQEIKGDRPIDNSWFSASVSAESSEGEDFVVMRNPEARGG